MEKVVELQEGAGEQVVDLELGKLLQKLGVCQVQLTQEGELRANNFSKVGFIRHGDTVVHIRPKISIRKVLQLLSPNLDDFQILESDVQLASTDDWTFALVDLFVASAKKALARGPLHGYKAVSDSADLVKGRIDFARQLKRNPGLPIPLEIDFDDFTPDIAENRIVLTALQVLLTRFSLPVEKRTALVQIEYLLSSVTPIPVHERVPRTVIGELNGHYAQVLRISDLILSYQGIESEIGETSVNSYLLNMERVFERYLENRFAALAEPTQNVFRAQGTGEALDRGGLVGIRPDYLWFSGPRAVGVADAKYKIFETQHSIPNDDVYQMVTYCTRYGLERGYLIYADAPSFSIDVEGSAISVEVRGVNLSLEIEEIERQVSGLVEEIFAEIK